MALKVLTGATLTSWIFYSATKRIVHLYTCYASFLGRIYFLVEE